MTRCRTRNDDRRITANAAPLAPGKHAGLKDASRAIRFTNQSLVRFQRFQPTRPRMNTSALGFLLVTFLGTTCALQSLSAAGGQFHGNWALTLPGGGAGWPGIEDRDGQPAASLLRGGVHSRISPSINAAKPAGEWQTLDITLLACHVTVVLNGKTVIDNAPVRGCTGGALWSDPFKPGPIYLQGDHSAIPYRSIVLTPITAPWPVSPAIPTPREP
jgi:hypothetical protein